MYTCCPLSKKSVQNEHRLVSNFTLMVTNKRTEVMLRGRKQKENGHYSPQPCPWAFVSVLLGICQVVRASPWGAHLFPTKFPLCSPKLFFDFGGLRSLKYEKHSFCFNQVPRFISGGFRGRVMGVWTPL